jgi:hypothetical protein
MAGIFDNTLQAAAVTAGLEIRTARKQTIEGRLFCDSGHPMAEVLNLVATVATRLGKKTLTVRLRRCALSPSTLSRKASRSDPETGSLIHTSA